MRRLPSRVLDALMLLWIVTTLTFALIHLAPGDPASLLIAPTASADEVARQRTAFGLDAPLVVQYGRWLAALLRGDLGTSMALSRPVSSVIGEALPVSLLLGASSLLISFVFGLLVGGVQAVRVGPRTDATLTAFITIAYAAPSFWLALALVTLVTSGAALVGVPLWMRLPAFGMHEPAALALGWDAWRDLARHTLLPVLVLALPGAAGVARFARGAMLDASGALHVQAATARGLSRTRVELRYILRTTLPLLVVLFGLMLPGVIAGSVFVEQIFAWPGLGRAMMGAIASRDYPVVLGLTLMYALVVIVSNLLADLLVIQLDPRRREYDVARTSDPLLRAPNFPESSSGQPAEALVATSPGIGA